jgi:hypothetical protein
MLPEPYWDFNMVQGQFNYAQTKKILNLACKTSLKSHEEKYLIKGLHLDKELVFHINMTPSKLPDLLINNPSIALELLICMNNTSEITRYYDRLASMKLSTNLLEVFN